MRNMCSRTALILLFSIVFKLSFAEGTKQVMPSSTNGVGIYINKTGLTGPYKDADASNRIKFTIKDNANEYIYLGLQAHDRNSYLEVPVYCKITGPSGASNTFQISTTAGSVGHIDNYNEAVAGPAIGTHTSGYNPKVFNPGSNGDYFLEVYTRNGTTDTANIAETVLTHFDVTINTSSTNYAPLPGRVHCQAWSFVTYDPTTFGIGLLPFTATGSTVPFYGLTGDSTVASISFNDGFDPLAFILYFNKYGVTNTGNFPADRKSAYNGGTAPHLPGYEVFLNSPDAAVYPRSAVPSAPSVIKIYGCTGNYYISYKTTAPGDVALLLDLNGTAGYQANTSDRYIYAYDAPAGINTVAWDGKNGLGVAVSSSANVKATLYLRRGRTNLPLFDAELNVKGLTVAGVDPVSFRPRLYWDDASLVTIGTGAVATDNLTGPGKDNSTIGQYAQPGRAWNGPLGILSDTAVPAAANGGGNSTGTTTDDYGNGRTLNTWFWTNEVASSEGTYTLAGCDRDGDGVSDITDIDDDNDGIADTVEDGVNPTADADGDGIPNYLDRDYGALNDYGVVASMDTDNDGIINSYDLDSDNDGIADLVEAGGVDTNGNGTVDYSGLWAINDTNNNGLLDRYDVTETNSTVTGVAIANLDTDGDGIPNFKDLDSDNDGIPDVAEIGGVDANGDGRIDGFVDTDQDGFADTVDGDVGNDGTAENAANALLKTGDYTSASNPVPVSYAEGINNPDGRGLPNPYDLDSDDDGIADVTEVGGVDLNYDGKADNFADTDGDGFNDTVDGDVGNDGVAENTAQALMVTGADTDAVKDGKPNSYPGADNSDGTGLPNPYDLDSDDDGIPDLIECGGIDANGGGRIDAPFTDANNNGWEDAYDPTATTPGINIRLLDANGSGVAGGLIFDFDGDGIPNYADLDSDNDGIPDIIEQGGTDANNDGKIDYTGTYASNDLDNDGFIDVYDPVNNITSLPTGKTPLITAAGPLSNGIATTYSAGDNFDGTGLINMLDLDADGDGITDIKESGLTESTTTLGFAAGTIGANGWSTTVSARSSLGLRNTDGVGNPNYLDIDSDDDGIVDIIEGQTTAAYIAPTGSDTDMDGIDNAYDATTVVGGAGIVPANKDSDALADYLDLDSDNDGYPDFVEGHDTDSDHKANTNTYTKTGLPGGTTDADGDGLLDGYDNNTTLAEPTNRIAASAATPLNYPNASAASGVERNWRAVANTDGTDITNATDIDDDNDGITDILESGGYDPTADADGDGIPNYLDTTPGTGLPAFVDVNGDRINDAYDTDLDGILNSLDLDSDNDGIADIIEAGGTDTNGDGVADSTTDADGDGLADIYDPQVTNGTAGTALTARDTDGDGVPNYRDLDSDNDGIPDLIESGGVDANGDGRIDSSTDTNGNGWMDAYDGALSGGIKLVSLDANGTTAGGGVFDFDGDNIPNYLDLDSDNDGIPDIIEQGGVDNGGGTLTNDGKVDATTDVDGDGFIDTYDPVNNNTAAALGTAIITAAGPLTTNNIPTVYSAGDNFDGTGLINMLDLDADGDGILDVRESGLTESTTTEGIAAGTTGTDGWSTTVNALPTLTLTNTDTRGGANYLDIDSDDDGITDNVEGQTTLGYILPSGIDADADGIDDSYDNVTTAFAGNGTKDITPVNTGGAAAPDYIDTDSDGDGISDVKEGYGDPAFALTAAQLAADADSDGLLDVFDMFNMTTLTTAMQAAMQSNVTMKYMGTNGVSNANPTLYGSSDRINKSSTISSADRDWRNAAIILPVKLISFTAVYSNKVSSINWVTANEDGHEQYLLERSTDGTSFQTISAVVARGTTTSNYTYADNAVPAVNVVYYRLQMVNADGSISYSKVVAIRLNADKLNLSIYPNPVIDQVSISFVSTTNQAVDVKVYNMQGVQVMAQTYTARTGTNTLQLTNWSKLPAGYYLIEVSNETFKLTHKLSHVH